MTKLTRGLIAAVLAMGVAASGAAPALAQQAKNLGTFNQWTAWQGADSTGVICYISSQPQDMKPAGANRDPVHFLVIHRKALGTKNEAQTIIGYPFNSTNPNVTASVDGRAFPMVTEGSAAWLASAKDESAFVTALKAGATLVVRGTSQRGTNTTDTYSLSGVTAAMGAIDKACA